MPSVWFIEYGCFDMHVFQILLVLPLCRALPVREARECWLGHPFLLTPFPGGCSSWLESSPTASCLCCEDTPQGQPPSDSSPWMTHWCLGLNTLQPDVMNFLPTPSLRASPPSTWRPCRSWGHPCPALSTWVSNVHFAPYQPFLHPRESSENWNCLLGYSGLLPSPPNFPNKIF